METTEQRLARLEENGYFLETHLKELDQQIVAQQTQLEALVKKVEQVQNSLAEIRSLLAEPRQARQEEPVPPHHIAKFW